MSKYFGLIDLMRNPLRTTPSIPPMAEMMNMPIVIYVRPNVIKSRRRCERALVSMKHPFPLKYTAYESGCEMQRHGARAVCRKRMGEHGIKMHCFCVQYRKWSHTLIQWGRK
jgi:hypothetical protein